MGKKRVLFVCTHNSARSQMAEAFLRELAGDRFEAESAGLEPRDLNPLVLEVMSEIGYDLTKKKADSVFDFSKHGKRYDYVIAVCDKAFEEKCPIFPGLGRRLHWPLDDPGQLEGSHEEKLHETRRIRDEIKSQVERWVKGFHN